MPNIFCLLGRLGLAAGGLVFGSEAKDKCGFFFWGKKESNVDADKIQNSDVFMWGNTRYLARPDWKDQFANMKPKHIKQALNEKGELMKEVPRFTQLVAKEAQVFGIDVKGNVWCFKNRKVPSFFDKSDPENFVSVQNERLNLDHTLTDVRNLSFPAKATKIGSTERYFWALSDSGDLYSCPIDSTAKPNWRKVPTINGLKDIATGNNHILMLTKAGKLWAMGNDEHGQCAGGEKPHQDLGPGVEAKILNPEKVAALDSHKIKRIFSKNDQNFVESETGDVFVFGSNSMMQLAFAKDYETSTRLPPAVVAPKRFNTYLDEAHCELKDIIMGREFTLFHCKNKETGLTQVYGTGLNLNGQLATGSTSHLSDFRKVELLSDYTIKSEKGEVPLDIKKISCGDDHCLAQMGIGVVMTWGANEVGQIGNRKRSPAVTPLIVTSLKNRNVNLVQAEGNLSYVLADREDQPTTPKD